MPVPHIARAPDLGDFKVEGARPFFAYADTGLAASTGGRFGATFVRTVRAVKPGDGTGWRSTLVEDAWLRYHFVFSRCRHTVRAMYGPHDRGIELCR